MSADANYAREGDADELLDRALDQMAAARPEAALPLLHEALELDPEHRAAAHALLRALEDAGRLHEALDSCQKLIAASSEDALLQTRLSILLQRAGDVPGAEAAAARAKILSWKQELRGSAED